MNMTVQTLSCEKRVNSNVTLLHCLQHKHVSVTIIIQMPVNLGKSPKGLVIANVIQVLFCQYTSWCVSITIHKLFIFWRQEVTKNPHLS